MQEKLLAIRIKAEMIFEFGIEIICGVAKFVVEKIRGKDSQ